MPPEETVIASGALKRTMNENGDGTKRYEFGRVRNGES